MAPPESAAPDDDEGGEEGETVVAAVVGVWVVLELLEVDVDVVTVEDAEMVVVRVESTLNDRIGLLAFLLKMCVA
jgi:hypothetical protein